MKIALLQNVPNLGEKGEIKDVSDGYGRNFLIKRKLAEILTPKLEKQLALQKEMREKSKIVVAKKYLILKKKIEELKLTFKTKIGETGKVFGSITPVKIIAELKKQGVNLEKEQVLSEPIKTLGEHKIKIKLPQGIETELKIAIEPSVSK
ncbi:50S ribosomal protein L9 [Candidatus Azambacteria bacterium RIFOXYD1_FULL_42_11]|uniref:Large ribosomal subunit protein bL9 n=3 Tax=Candidatus Azamiibacteriota TaxID=1752741 RepID=A0A0G1CAI6_9BACT|nr:MAG: 50S ribosomal protein L9 [Candidatus Azambacteria bacterium GW2011_GWA1_42_19]KKS75818.1 MAG: 50S ribosomal protein L9 [Candidatus Azambacteria bacterium GW2011_GWA2_42_9]KKS88929.1 MAG: 50S ribosomal protein L9 [Parcubacteria group bacterium GW2011_GWC1_43_11]OGD41778.1 MAG: 50S ribosomal protein L9 [Candidatus Azambacteria bacterium RIFOXYD1_FULL_42_11]